MRYALDDVRDVEVLSSLATPTEFYQTQLLPRSFQAVATGGPGEKLNDLMLRVYLMDGHSVPTAESSRGYAGGHAELLATGVFRPVVKCDVESLYPSIMLSEGITSSRDTLGAYLPMLAELTRRRLEAKAESRRAVQAGQEAERAMWEGMQGSFKVLINSFYGYLGLWRRAVQRLRRRRARHAGRAAHRQAGRSQPAAPRGNADRGRYRRRLLRAASRCRCAERQSKRSSTTSPPICRPGSA